MGKRYDKAGVADILDQAVQDGVLDGYSNPIADNSRMWTIKIAGHPGPVELTTPQAWAFAVGIEATTRALSRPKLTLLG